MATGINIGDDAIALAIVQLREMQLLHQVRTVLEKSQADEDPYFVDHPAKAAEIVHVLQQLDRNLGGKIGETAVEPKNFSVPAPSTKYYIIITLPPET